MKYLFAFLLLAQSTLLFSQQADSLDKLIADGVAFHDEGDYESAIQKYDQVISADPKNVTAWAEKAYSLISMGEYDESIEACKKAISSDPESKHLKIVYTTYGNALDALEKPVEAIKIYDEGISHFPEFYQLYFNKGITLTDLNDYDKAVDNFHSAARLNPTHASSHNAIGRIEGIDKTMKIPSLLALCRFMAIEPVGSRAKANLPLIQDIMKGGAEKTGKNKVNITIDPATLGNPDSDEKMENDFSTTGLILALSAALDFDKKNKKKSAVELFQGKFETVCSSLTESQEGNFGFYWKYYAPYFIEMKEKEQIETFSYLVFATDEDKATQQWLKDNEAKVKSFFVWSSAFEWSTE